MLGLSLLLLLFGGLSLDFWRGLAMQRELASVADSAALAAASGIDEVLYRDSGEILLDSDRAVSLAMTSIAFQDVEPIASTIAVASDGAEVTVTLEAQIELGLLAVFIDDDSPLVVRASSTAHPLLLP